MNPDKCSTKRCRGEIALTVEGTPYCNPCNAERLERLDAQRRRPKCQDCGTTMIAEQDFCPNVLNHRSVMIDLTGMNDPKNYPRAAEGGEV